MPHLKLLILIVLGTLLTSCSSPAGSMDLSLPGTIGYGFSLDQTTHVLIWIENSYQTKVKTLMEDTLQVGIYSVNFKPVDDQGKPLPYGFYTIYEKIGGAKTKTSVALLGPPFNR